MATKKPTIIRIDDGMQNLIDAESRRTGASKSEVIRRAVYFYLSPGKLPIELLEHAGAKVHKAIAAMRKQ